jgi:hypothetical protein
MNVFQISLKFGKNSIDFFCFVKISFQIMVEAKVFALLFSGLVLMCPKKIIADLRSFIAESFEVSCPSLFFEYL